MSDPDVPETRQPYHDGLYHQQNDARELSRRLQIVKRCVERSVAALLKDAALDGSACAGAGLVVGRVIDPAHVGNPHIRAHANEGRLFRVVLEEALEKRGLTCRVIVEKELAVVAATELRRAPREITRAVAGFGRALGSPWRADEKAAAVAAWLAMR